MYPDMRDPVREGYEKKLTRWCPVDQVANGPDAAFNLTPVDPTRAAAVYDAWAAWLPGQAVPLVGEIPRDPYECEPV